MLAVIGRRTGRNGWSRSILCTASRELWYGFFLLVMSIFLMIMVQCGEEHVAFVHTYNYNRSMLLNTTGINVVWGEQRVKEMLHAGGAVAAIGLFMMIYVTRMHSPTHTVPIWGSQYTHIDHFIDIAVEISYRSLIALVGFVCFTITLPLFIFAVLHTILPIILHKLADIPKFFPIAKMTSAAFIVCGLLIVLNVFRSRRKYNLEHDTASVDVMRISLQSVDDRATYPDEAPNSPPYTDAEQIVTDNLSPPSYEESVPVHSPPPWSSCGSKYIATSSSIK